MNDPSTRCKTCPRCQQSKPLDLFAWKSQAKGTRQSYCRDCWREYHFQRQQRDDVKARRLERRSTPAAKRRLRNYQLTRDYGMTVEEYEHRLRLQKNLCAICRDQARSSARKLNVDHNHKTGAVRMLLCSQCNRGIGLLMDDPAVLERAARYVASFAVANAANDDQEPRSAPTRNRTEI